ncbi:unnamed protein product, partial [Candidula unifasciata]
MFRKAYLYFYAWKSISLFQCLGKNIPVSASVQCFHGYAVYPDLFVSTSVQLNLSLSLSLSLSL